MVGISWRGIWKTGGDYGPSTVRELKNARLIILRVTFVLPFRAVAHSQSQRRLAILIVEQVSLRQI